jgi:hypothetical protein
MVNISFPHHHEVKNTIQHQHFFSNLNILDLKARKAQSQDEYKYRYINGIKPLSRKEQVKISSLVNSIQPLLAPYGKVATIPWKIAKIDDTLENGYPHTLGDIIFLPEQFFNKYNDSDMLKTLLHEQIHVYQRKFPLETNVLICRFWGYDIQGVLAELPNNRSNPDLNGLVYCKKGYISYQRYNSSNPTSLADSNIVGHDKYEHPYERMAYEIPRIIIDHKDENNTSVWMKSYF